MLNQILKSDLYTNPKYFFYAMAKITLSQCVLQNGKKLFCVNEPQESSKDYNQVKLVILEQCDQKIERNLPNGTLHIYLMQKQANSVSFLALNEALSSTKQLGCHQKSVAVFIE